MISVGHRNTISAAFDAVVSTNDDFVLIHSSLYAFRIAEAELKWPLLAAIRRMLAAGHTVAIPAFTFSFCRNGRFDPRTSDSETGNLASWALELEDFRRTDHPIYSFVVAGPRADEILACPSGTTFGPDSPFGLFDRQPTRLVMLGCGWDVCTQFHYYEEQAAVAYRHYKNFESIDRDAERSARMYVRDQWIGAENDFSPAVESLRGEGQIASVPLGQGAIESVSANALGNVCRELLSDNPFAFVKDASHVQFKVRMAQERTAAGPLKVAILGSANTDLLREAVQKRLCELFVNRTVETFAPPFGQAWVDVVRQDSGLHEFRPDFAIFVDRLEDINDTIGGVSAVINEESLARYCDCIEVMAEQPQCHVFVNSFANIQRQAGEQSVSAKMTLDANALLEARVAINDSVHILDFATTAATYQGDAVFDPRLWFLGRLPFAQDFNDHLAQHYAGLIGAASGATARLLVVDLDNTLWGGILGEDGMEGLALGGDFPGNAFRHFQTILKQFAQRGIAIALASKNDEAEALSVINTHPDMVIRESDLAGWRIGWQEKPDSVVQLADELGLGLANIAFIDDNPAERARMRAALPEVKVIELPDDPSRYAETVLSSPWLTCLTVTKEDMRRSENYSRARKARSARQRFQSENDYLAYLAPKIHITPLLSENANRAAQLIAKTNQFNTTTRRMTLDELRELDGNDASVLVIGLEDRFLDLENIGVCVVRWNSPEPGDAEIDPFLLSCRVLGRGVETGFLAWLTNHARAQNMRRLIGTIAEAPRNKPARAVYDQHGFATGELSGRWVYNLSEQTLTAPNWVEIVEKVEPSSHH